MERINFDMGDQQPVEMTELDGKKTLVGYAVVWGAVSAPDSKGNRYQFSKDSISWTPEVFAVKDHDMRQLLARTGNGSLRITSDEKGVKTEIDIPDTSLGRDTYEEVKSQLVKGMSFAGYLGSTTKTDTPKLFAVNKFAADEVTVTAFPRMTETSITAMGLLAPEPPTENIIAREKDFRANLTKLQEYRLKLYTTGKVSDVEPK